MPTLASRCRTLTGSKAGRRGPSSSSRATGSRSRDVEGGQACELIAFGEDGRADPTVLGATSLADRDSDALVRERRIIDSASGWRSAASIWRRPADPAVRQRLACRRRRSRFAPSAADTLVVSAPGERDAAGRSGHGDADRAADRARARRAPPRNASSCPSRLADPLQDIRVNRATAEAYLVRAGEYIQIIDVAGRQCSDFQCFSARKLDKGRELPLDATTTRSLTGLGYPAPGLPAKASTRTWSRWSRSCGHGRPPRRLRARLLRQILRGHGLSGPRQLHRQFQRRARPLWR